MKIDDKEITLDEVNGHAVLKCNGEKFLSISPKGVIRFNESMHFMTLGQLNYWKEGNCVDASVNVDVEGFREVFGAGI